MSDGSSPTSSSTADWVRETRLRPEPYKVVQVAWDKADGQGERGGFGFIGDNGGWYELKSGSPMEDPQGIPMTLVPHFWCERRQVPQFLWKSVGPSE